MKYKLKQLFYFLCFLTLISFRNNKKHGNKEKKNMQDNSFIKIESKKQIKKIETIDNSKRPEKKQITINNPSTFEELIELVDLCMNSYGHERLYEYINSKGESLFDIIDQRILYMIEKGEFENIEQLLVHLVNSYTKTNTADIRSKIKEQKKNSIIKLNQSREDIVKQIQKISKEAPLTEKLVLDYLRSQAKFIIGLVALSPNPEIFDLLEKYRDTLEDIMDIYDDRSSILKYLQEQDYESSIQLIDRLLDLDKLNMAIESIVYLLFTGIDYEKIKKYEEIYQKYLKFNNLNDSNLKLYRFETFSEPSKIYAQGGMKGLINKRDPRETKLNLYKFSNTKIEELPELVTLKEGDPFYEIFKNSLEHSNAIVKIYEGKYPNKDINKEVLLKSIIDKLPQDFTSTKSVQEISSSLAYNNLLSPGVYGTVYSSGDGFAISRIRLLNVFLKIATISDNQNIDKVIEDRCRFYFFDQGEWFDKHSIDRIGMIIINQFTLKYWVILFQDID